jgi:serine protease Do
MAAAKLGLFAVVVALVGLSGPTGAAVDESAPPDALAKRAPEGVADLRTIEQHVTALAEKVLPCTVALQVGGARASGVIVTADGYVLTAAHVIGRPGRDVTITFSDGRTVEGKTLGLNPDVDGGLVRMNDEGPWPFAPIATKEEAPKRGDWCVAAGHPGGFHPGRTPPLRLGRVIAAEASVVRTDCTISMGDSGGPLFDMRGRVIGIHSRIAEQTTMNLHVPAATYQEAWDVLKAGEIAARKASNRFLTRLDVNGDGKIVRSEITDEFLLQVYDRMASKLELDPEKPYELDDLRKSLGFSSPRSFDPRNLPAPTVILDRSSESLPRDEFAQGRAVRAAFAQLVAETRRATVRVKCEGKDVALGAIVAADGWIVTKASELANPDKIVCVLSDGRELDARWIGAEAACDLAVLRVEASELKAVEFQSGALRPGMWLASPGQVADRLGVGVVSVAERLIARSPGVLGVLIDDREEGATVRQVMPGSGAAAAGIKAGDVITHIAAEPVARLAELQAAVRKHRVGDVIEVTGKRVDETLELSVRLGMPDTGLGNDPIRVVGALSARRDDFPAAVQHDTVLRPSDCGGPVVDLSGHVIGINVARADRTGSYVLPSATVLAMIERIKAQAPARPAEGGK